MRRAQIEKQRRIRQRNLERATCKNLIYHVIICLFIMIVALCGAVGKCMENPEDIVESQHETTRPQPVPTIQVDTQEDEVKAEVVVPMCPKFTYSKDWVMRIVTCWQRLLWQKLKAATFRLRLWSL